MEFKTIFLAIVGSVIAYLASQALTRRRRANFCSKNGCKPPPATPQKAWTFGLDMVSDMMRWTKEKTFLQNLCRLLQESHGTCSMNLAGVEYIWTMEPENLKAMLASKAEDFELSQLRMDGFAPYTGEGIVSVNGAKWAHGRALLRPSFTKAQISNSEIYERHFQNLVMNVPKDGSTVDLKGLFGRMTLDVATEILFGESTLSQRPDAPQSIRDVDSAFEYASLGVKDRWNMGSFTFLHRDPRFWASVKLLHEYADSHINKAFSDVKSSGPADRSKDVESSFEKYIFLNELVKDLDDKKLMRDHLMTSLIGGRDTTMALLSHTFLHLSRNPNPLARLRKEIAQLNGAPPTYEQLKDLKYLRWTIDETLRITPSAPMYDRSANRDTFLPVGGGPDGKSPMFVKKGQGVGYILYAVNHSEKQWGPDVEEFRPERWDGMKYSWNFTPFGGGARICPGQQLALNQASYIIVRMLQTFSGLESRDDSVWQEELGITLAPSIGTKVALTR